MELSGGNDNSGGGSSSSNNSNNSSNDSSSNNSNNNSSTSDCVEVVITLRTDRYSADTSHWLQEGNKYIFYDNTFSSFRTYTESACINPTVCSQYNIRDTFGDGISGEGVEIKYDGEWSTREAISASGASNISERAETGSECPSTIERIRHQDKEGSRSMKAFCIP